MGTNIMGQFDFLDALPASSILNRYYMIITIN
jgi:hypothetical protein